MKAAKVAAIAGALVLAAVVFFVLGRLTRGPGDGSRQHVNRSSDPKEFRNAFLGLTVRAPQGDEWVLVFEPDRFRHTPAHVNKVLEINRMLEKGSPDQQWARMDLFVEPLRGSSEEQALRKLEFRELRQGFAVVGTETATVGGHSGSLRLGAWTVKRTGYRTATYSVAHRGRLYAFIGVTEGKAFARFRPVFDQIVSAAVLK